MGDTTPEKTFTRNTILERLGLQDTNADCSMVFCEGEDCAGCEGYVQGDGGKCNSCGCGFIDHKDVLDEYNDEDEDYESVYGGAEDW